MAIFTKGVPEMKAEKVTYDNTTSEFVADDVQGAIDEIDTSVDNLNAMQAVVKEYTLSATGWDTNNTYTITDSLITTGTNASTQIIGYPSEQYSDEMYEVLAAANIRVVSVATGEIRLKAMDGAPSIDLPITITYRVGADPLALTVDSTVTSGSNNLITSGGVYNSSFFAAGESYTLGNDFSLSGYLSNSNKAITFVIPLPKKSTGNITINSLAANIRMGTGGYAAVQGAYVSGGFNYLPYYNGNILSPSGSYYVSLTITFSDSQNATNNQPVSVAASNITITFN